MFIRQKTRPFADVLAALPKQRYSSVFVQLVISAIRARRMMSEQSATSKVDIAKYKKLLLDMREQLTEEVRALGNASLKSDHEPGAELADVGSDNFTQEVEIKLMAAEETRIRAIDTALSRLGQGTFGICKDCDKPVSEARLLALPFAQLCIACKEQHERRDAGLA